MKLEVTVTGIDKLADRLRTIGLARRFVGEVRIDGARNTRLANIHAGPEPRTKIPLRNPFFLRDADAPKVVDELRKGAAAVAAGGSPETMRQHMLAAVHVVAESMRQNFGMHASSGTQIATGRPMRPLSPAYARWKTAKFGAQPILVATGQLRGSVKAGVIDAGVGGTA